MAIFRFDFSGSPNIGVYSLTTNRATIIPLQLSEKKIKVIEEGLGCKVIITTIGESRLVGVLAAGNSNGLVFPHFTSNQELETVQKLWKGNCSIIENKKTALGNLILVNDYGAIASTHLLREKSVSKEIQDVLDVEIVPGKIAGLPYVGSLAIATNKGVLAHPMLTDGERKLLLDVLKVPVDVGTVNEGIPFVASGLLASDQGVLVGSHTTGTELLIISNLFER